MSKNLTALRGFCPPPFFQQDKFPTEGGYVEGRLCQSLLGPSCCLPCPMTDWVYPDEFNTLSRIADWANVAGSICCIFLLLSWAFLPIEKTNRHYLSISLTCAVFLMSLGFTVPLAAKPEQCYNEITPNSMTSNNTCAVSGAFLLFGGFAGVMWVFLRAVSLHLQICWQVVVGKRFLWISQAAGWGVPLVGITLALVFSGVSFRFGSTCHINHANSLADFWIPLLIFAGLTVIISFATFGYCIKVYLASLADNGPSTEGSGLPSYTNSIRTLSPRQAYRRIRRVIALQWRGITIVLIIITDVIFFSLIFVFQDTTVENIRSDPTIAQEWALCLIKARGDKNKCLDLTGDLVVPEATVTAVLLLLALNGVWLLFLLGRLAMVTGWVELIAGLFRSNQKKEFVSVDARLDMKKDTRSYEMLSRDSGKTLDTIVTPLDPAKSAISPSSGRRTPDYFVPAAQSARYQPPPRSYSSPRPPQSRGWDGQHSRNQSQQSQAWDMQHTRTVSAQSREWEAEHQRSPSGWSATSPSSEPRVWDAQQTYARPGQAYPQGYEDLNPLGMNRI